MLDSAAPSSSGISSTSSSGMKLTSVTIDRIGEPALIAVRGQRQIAEHEVSIGFEEDPLRALPACLDGLDHLHHLVDIGSHVLGIGRQTAKPERC